MHYIGDRIKSERLSQGLTQVQLGKKCRMADSAIRRYESNRGNPTMATLKRIANALNVTVEYLLGGESEDFDFSKDDIILSTGDEFLDSQIKVVNISQSDDGSFSVEFRMNKGKISAEQFQILMNEMKRLSQKYKISLTIPAFNRLNDEGLSKAMEDLNERVNELTEIPKYQRQEPPQASPPSPKGEDTTSTPDATEEQYEPPELE